MTDVTLGASGLWLGTQTGAGGTATLTESFFWLQPMAPWTTGKQLSVNSVIKLETGQILTEMGHINFTRFYLNLLCKISKGTLQNCF